MTVHISSRQFAALLITVTLLASGVGFTVARFAQPPTSDAAAAAAKVRDAAVLAELHALRKDIGIPAGASAQPTVREALADLSKSTSFRYSDGSAPQPMQRLLQQICLNTAPSGKSIACFEATP